MSKARKVTSDALLVGTFVPTSTTVLRAIEPTECVECEARIHEDELFTLGKAVGYGPRLKPYCATCRPFQIREQ